MVLFKFFGVSPIGEITGSMIALLALVLVLVHSEAFDNFSVGTILSLSRGVKEKEQEVEKLERSNQQLVQQLVAISTSQSQRQHSINVSGDYHAAPSVEKATAEEVKESKSVEAQQPSADRPNQQRFDWARAEAIALQKYVAERDLHPSNVVLDAKLVSHFHGVDPVSTLQPVFDGYVKGPDREIFIEFRPERFLTPMYRDRLYFYLSKIAHYRAAKRVDASLDLVMIKVPGEESKLYPGGGAIRVLNSFEPAIAGGILRVQEIALTEEEAATCRVER